MCYFLAQAFSAFPSFQNLSFFDEELADMIKFLKNRNQLSERSARVSWQKRGKTWRTIMVRVMGRSRDSRVQEDCLLVMRRMFVVKVRSEFPNIGTRWRESRYWKESGHVNCECMKTAIFWRETKTRNVGIFSGGLRGYLVGSAIKIVQPRNEFPRGEGWLNKKP